MVDELDVVRGHVLEEGIEGTHDETRREKSELRALSNEANALDLVLDLWRNIHAWALHKTPGFCLISQVTREEPRHLRPSVTAMTAGRGPLPSSRRQLHMC